ncbi:NAD-dependent epimerase/dehydratase family protein [Acetobacterium bakii]|uniref:NAD-dependent epimerase/dehydratase domain-containing protein n=1 Tax=Acetobacterium bakii TaxID=52689 RepID=A0A0L6U1Y7_9FIRM|nr:NAD-dependent epimerase/dehydratase family protein [Acetobacterium bakii]KNZ42534.1 hypothetical protein AKG39_06350 [Acetobacterium bakii]
MEKLFIIGGFGFIGKNLIINLISEYDIVVVDRKLEQCFKSQYPKLKFYACDLINDNNIEEILYKESPQYIINLVSIVTAERNIDMFDDMININLKVLLKLYNASKNLKSLKLFLHFGSGEEYGNIKSPFYEIDRENPNSPYALCKQITTNTAIMLHQNFEFPITVVRPGNLFGQYQEESKFIPYIINQLMNNNTIITTPGEQKRDFIYVNDFAKGIKLMLRNSRNFIGEIVNLSSGDSVTLKKLMEFCKRYINSDSVIDFGGIPYRENEIMDFKLDISKFKDNIDEKFSVDIFMGLIDYIESKRF